MDANTMMMCSPKVLASGTVLAWVGWTMLSNYVFLNLELYQNEFMFRVVASMFQLSVLFITCVAYHVKSGKQICETLSRLLFFGFILGIIVGPGNVIAHQAISQSGATLFLVTTLPLMPICWAVNYCMSVEPFNKTQATLLLIAIGTFFWMYTNYSTYTTTYVVTRNDSYTLYFELFKSEGVTSGFFFTFYLAMVLLMFEMAMPFLNGQFDIINQIFLMEIFSFLFNLAGVFKYEQWNLGVVMKPSLIPYIAAYAFLDFVLILGLFLSVHPSFEKDRHYLLFRAPLAALLCTVVLGEPFDLTTMIGGSILFACAAFGEYARYIETLARGNFNNMLPEEAQVQETPSEAENTAETALSVPPQPVA
jgi:hypothetical protein